MADSKDTPVPIGGIAVLLLLAVGVFVKHQWPLETSRPGDGQLRSISPPNVRDLDARLWEDPFAALGRLKKPEDGAPGAAAAARADPDLQSLAARVAPDKQLLVLGVMVYATPYADETELRRRTRYAVLAGLHAGDYSPELYDKIGYFRTGAPPAGAAAWRSAPELVPYELYVTEDRKREVALLWLAEEDFGERMAENLGAFLGELKRAFARHPSVRFGLVGPASSSGLIDITRGCVPQPKPDPALGAPVEVYSANATAVDAAKLPELLGCRVAGADGRGLTVQMSVVSTITPDARVLEALIDELALRGFAPGRDHVILASEWDTEYGLTLPRQFIAAGCDRATPARRVAGPAIDDAPATAADAGDACRGDATHDPAWVTRLSYLRGLDGDERASAAKRAAKDKPDGGGADKDAKTREPNDRAIGNGQYDYLRRLADSVEQRARSAPGAREVKAVGVLGSDPYDKLLLLQALRPQFPKAIFFTTDLDARYIHPAEFEWTHNLIVASAHGLELAEAVQGRAPPFRDAYQTSAFLATRLALDRDTPFAKKRERLGHWLASPRVYEIGRSRAYAFQPRGTAPAASGCRDLADCADIRPPLPFFLAPGETRSWALVVAALALIVVSVAAGVWLLRIYLRSFHEATVRVGEALRRPAIGYPALAVVLGVTALALCVPFNSRGEPFTWTAGISIWPSEIIRLAALALCAVFIGRMLRPVALADDEPDGAFFDAGPGASAVAPGTAPAYARVNDGYDEYHDSPGEVDAVTLWRQFRALERPRKRWSRLWPQLVAYAIVFGCLLVGFHDRPNVPARGEFSRGVEHVMSVLSMGAFLAVLLLVIDVIRLGSTFIRNLSTSRSVYPAGTIARVRGELGLGAGHPDHYLCDLLDIRLIAAYTERINAFVYYPFVVLALIVVARSPIFDDWYLPPALALVFLYALVAAVVCAVVLQRAASRAREIAVGRMRG
ncbi:MAG TPA: hypothetical protein VI319_06805, partial [Burkholderiales bacterium]